MALPFSSETNLNQFFESKSFATMHLPPCFKDDAKTAHLNLFINTAPKYLYYYDKIESC